jgi:signal transduction histidine kinase
VLINHNDDSGKGDSKVINSVSGKKYSNNDFEQIQKLLYGISHDMGAPLRSVVQFSQLLEKRLHDKLDDKERFWFQLLQQGGQKAQKMLEALLHYSRLNTEQAVATNINLVSLIEDSIEAHIRKRRRKDRQNEILTDNASKPSDNETPFIVDWQILSPLPEITGILMHWELFFSCLLDNALLYQPLGQPRHIPKIAIYSETEKNLVRIIIEDNGIGVAENNWSNITQPFKRLQPEADYPGIGMGLSYCERIAQLHGGKLSFQHSAFAGLKVIYTYVDPK